jgi:hypothetical protein
MGEETGFLGKKSKFLLDEVTNEDYHKNLKSVRN